jgi:hypothetical protein
MFEIPTSQTEAAAIQRAHTERGQMVRLALYWVLHPLSSLKNFK